MSRIKDRIDSEAGSDQQRILITGVSGLIGRILFQHIAEKHPDKYEVFGLDQHLNTSSRYEWQNAVGSPIKPIPPIPPEKFVQCDVTDKSKLHQIIEKLQIDIIIHLAALLENHGDVNKIASVNIDGTRNVFEAPDVRRIIYASSIRTVFGYLEREPYLSIFNDTFDDETGLAGLHRLTVAGDPPLSGSLSENCVAYAQSKIMGEQMAADTVRHSSKSIICARFGWVNIDDHPGAAWSRTMWCSYRDLCSFIDKALEAPAQLSGTYFVVSNNHRLWVDLEHTRRDLGFVPQDGAERPQFQ